MARLQPTNLLEGVVSTGYARPGQSPCGHIQRGLLTCGVALEGSPADIASSTAECYKIQPINLAEVIPSRSVVPKAI